MSRNVGNALEYPTFIKAKSANDLQKLMLKNNLKWHTQFVYFSIYESGGDHYAWFLFDHRRLTEIDNRSENE